MWNRKSFGLTAMLLVAVIVTGSLVTQSYTGWLVIPYVLSLLTVTFGKYPPLQAFLLILLASFLVLVMTETENTFNQHFAFLYCTAGALLGALRPSEVDHELSSMLQ